MQKITPFLWFDTQAEEAANYYVSVFSAIGGSAEASREGGKNSKINAIVRYPKSAEAVAGKPAGSVMTVVFELEGEPFTALNGGKVPGFEFSSAISFVVTCETQQEIDYYWEKLSAVPEAEQCGWCKDKFGITWQIVPAVLGRMLSDPDQSKVERVTAAFMPMKKFDIAALEKAYNG